MSPYQYVTLMVRLLLMPSILPEEWDLFSHFLQKYNQSAFFQYLMARSHSGEVREELNGNLNLMLDLS